MAADLLAPIWNILSKEEHRNVRLNFLEYMAITKALTFSKDAERLMVDIGPFRPKMLNLVFTQQKGCQHIYRKTVQHDMRILQKIANR